MHRILIFAAALLVTGLSLPHAAFAQTTNPPPLPDPDLSHQEMSPNQAPDPAQIADMAKSVRQVPLTEDMVDRFIQSYAPMEAVGKKFPTTSSTVEPPKEQEPTTKDAQPPSVNLGDLPSEKRDAMTEVATKYGFKDIDEWATVGSSIAMSYTYVLQGKKPGAVDEAINMHIAEVKDDASLSQEQKQAQIGQLKDLGANLAKLEPLQENFTLVQRMKSKVAPIMKFE